MLLDGKRIIFKLVISVLMCTSLAGQTEPLKTASSTFSTTNVTANNKNTTSNVTSLPNNITLSTTPAEVDNQDYLLSDTDRRNVRIVTMTVAATGILLNAAVILAIIFDPLKILQRGSWITIFNLAVADFIACISTFFYWGEVYFSDQYYSILYIVGVDFGRGFGFSSSFIYLTFLSMQIYVVTKFPFKSRFMFTTRRIILVTIAIWLFASLSGLCHLAYLHFTAKISFLIYMIHVSLVVILLSTHLVLSFKVSVEIMKSGRSSVGRRSYQINRHKNIAKTVVILTLILFFTAFPYFVSKQIQYCSMNRYFGTSKTVNISSYFSFCYAPIMIMNFAANPILYSLRLPEYRRTLLVFVGKAKCRVKPG